jgi:hypothetical protein
VPFEKTTRGLLVGVALLSLTSGTAVADVVIYDSIPSPLPPNVVSLGYQATSTSEFGDYIRFAGSARTLNTVTVGLSSWALKSNNLSFGGSTSFDHALTLNLYTVDTAGGTPAIGSLITSATMTATIPFREEADSTCPGGTAYRASDGNCYNGLFFTVDFDIFNVVVPDEIIFGLEFNTQSYGDDPTGVNGPYNSLNFGLASAAPTVGTDVEPDALFWDTSHAPFLTTGVAGEFSRDTGWSPNTPTVRFSAVPEPGSLALICAGFVSVGLLRRRRR